MDGMDEGSRLAKVGGGRVQIATLAGFSIAWDEMIKVVTQGVFPAMPFLRKGVVVPSCSNAWGPGGLLNVAVCIMSKTCV